MVEINWTVGVQIINFLILIFVLNLVAYKPIRKILLKRKSTLDGMAESIEATSLQTEEIDAAFSTGLREARGRGKREKDALLQAADDEEKAILGRINDQSREELAAVKARIVTDADAVKVVLEKEINTFAEAITRKILGRAA